MERFVIIFDLKGSRLATYPFEVEQGDTFERNVAVAFECFRKECDVSLFDGVNISVSRDA